MTADEKAHMERVASLGCIVCRLQGRGYVPCQVHHIRTGQGKGQRASHFLTFGLCPNHHTDGGYGVAIHAGRQAFERAVGYTELEILGICIAFMGRAYYA